MLYLQVETSHRSVNGHVRSTWNTAKLSRIVTYKLWQIEVMGMDEFTSEWALCKVRGQGWYQGQHYPFRHRLLWASVSCSIKWEEWALCFLRWLSLLQCLISCFYTRLRLSLTNGSLFFLPPLLFLEKVVWSLSSCEVALDLPVMRTCMQRVQQGDSTEEEKASENQGRSQLQDVALLTPSKKPQEHGVPSHSSVVKGRCFWYKPEE